MGVQINGDTGNISATKADYSGNVTIGGTLTYEDVTNIDSVGLITAREGIEVGARPGVAASISVDGNAIFSGITTIGGNVKVGTGITLSPDGDAFHTGVVTATSFKGDGSQLSNITSTTINSNADNRVITGSDTANTLNGESTLTFDGTNLSIGGNVPEITLTDANASGTPICKLSAAGGNINIQADTASGKSDTYIAFSSDGTERLRIDTSGNVTKPTNFHILVDLSQNYTVQNASTTNTDLVKWDRVITAESSTGASSYFNTSTHLFTAPVDGIYLFHIAVNCDFNVEGAWLVIDGSRENYTAVAPPSQNTSSVSLTHKLTASQTVGVKWYDAGNTNADFFSNDLHTWWKITLLG